MKGLLIAALILCLGFGGICYAQEAQEANEEALPITVLFDEEAYEKKSESALAAWLGYAMSRAVWVRDHYTEEDIITNGYQPSFEEQIDAYSNMVQIWRELKEKDPNISDVYLNLLERIDDDGFLKEYIWVYLHNGSWGGFPDVDTKSFDAYAKKYLVGHDPEVIATIKVDLES